MPVRRWPRRVGAAALWALLALLVIVWIYSATFWLALIHTGDEGTDSGMFALSPIALGLIGTAIIQRGYMVWVAVAAALLALAITITPIALA